ncbi:MAG: DEAD/DEAH box helicase [Chitinophagales bacterium]|nr:DEAD/DEAH box helicase [Bacteroidota bacterium]MCB9257129.1 DEAD/DEAH box helicase [Chitinophagales bacterium]
MQKFQDLGLDASILDALAQKGFSEPTPIQEKVIPILLQRDRNVVGQAQTGTGKTAAFGLPIVQNIEERSGKVQAIILAPTRELAVQVAEEMDSFKGKKRLQITTVYGGQPIDRQIRELQKGADIVVGTPGRVIDLIKRNKLQLSEVKYFVLDEADEMLNMGFIEDIEYILSETNDDKQVLLFSATMPSKILKLAKKYMGDYELLHVEKSQVTTENTEQLYYAVSAKDKMKVLERIMEMTPDFYGIVFCNTRMGTDDVTRELNKMGVAAEALHGDVQQNQRERILQRFKNKACTVLCATDVAARGIDVNELTHVINYQLPQDPEAYVHRIGRTGRAGNKGVAISLIANGEKKQMNIIQSISKVQMTKAELPSAKEMIQAKMDKIFADIITTELTEKDANILKLATRLIESNESSDVLTAALKYFLKDELQAKNFEEIKMQKDLGGTKGNGEVRLFVAKGKRDRMSPQDLEAFICAQSGIASNAFLDTFMLDEFSFVTLESDDADVVLARFKNITSDGKSVITKAKQRDGGGGSSRGGSKFGAGSREKDSKFRSGDGGRRNDSSSSNGGRRRSTETSSSFGGGRRRSESSTSSNAGGRRRKESSGAGNHNSFYGKPSGEKSKFKNAKY